MFGKLFDEEEGGVMMREERRISPPEKPKMKKTKEEMDRKEAINRELSRMRSGSVTDEQPKKKKLVRKRLTKEEIDRALSINTEKKGPFSLTEANLARIKNNPVELKRHQRFADVYFGAQELIKREQQYTREELETLGYVERDVEVTDDEADAGDN